MANKVKKALIILGASGVGKGTVMQHLFSKHSEILSFVISYTTRQPRNDQINGLHYRFVNHQQFQNHLPDMLENKIVFKNKYGTSRTHYEQILRQNKIPILDIDIEGTVQIMKKINCEVLCIMPPSWQVLHQRLQSRKSESLKAFQVRMNGNRNQIKKMEQLEGLPNVYYTVNFQYQLTTFGIQNWMQDKFSNFDKYYNHKVNRNKKLLESN